ncbi:MAG: hypothetical protein K8T20_07085 [Planctomycetes bacterium]|nr:hypothetical protein [Planctomycetota bacterium]
MAHKKPARLFARPVNCSPLSFLAAGRWPLAARRSPLAARRSPLATLHSP